MKRMKQNLDIVKYLIQNKDYDWIHIVEGPEGIGKTTLAWHICKHVDPNFTAKNIVFEIDQLRLLLQNSKKGTAILIDEGAFLLFSRNAMVASNKEIVQTLTMIRAKNLFICICIPVFQILDLYIREHRVKSLTKVIKRGWFHFYSKKRIKQIHKNTRTKEYEYPEPNFKDGFTQVKGREWQAYLRKKGDILDRTMKWITISQVAKKNKVTPAAVRVWCKNGKLKCEKTLGGHWRISTKEAQKKYRSKRNHTLPH